MNLCAGIDFIPIEYDTVFILICSETTTTAPAASALNVIVVFPSELVTLYFPLATVVSEDSSYSVPSSPTTNIFPGCPETVALSNGNSTV